jgi:hypothetical protein
MKLLERAYAPTPKFFKLLRAIGLTIAALGGSLIAAPVALPILVTSIAGYMTLAGGLLSAVSQLTITDEKPDANQ